MSVTAGLERFSWGEYSSSGAKLLDENGPRLALGFNWLQDGAKGFLFGYSGKYYTNDVNYNGQTQSGVPFTTKTNYGGLLNEAVLHYRLENDFSSEDTDHHYLDVVGGVALDVWTRDIKSDGSVIGYKEYYTIGFLRAGIEMVPVRSGLRAAAGFKYPFYTNEKVGLQSAVGADSDPVLKPKPDISYYASIGWRFNNPWSVTLEFDSYRFKQSDGVDIFYGGAASSSKAVQPESRMEVITLKAGYSF